MSHLINEIVIAQKRGDAIGIASICSAHPWVLRATMQGERPILVESTCNQVNQFGGYTGMTPADFVRFIHNLAHECNFPKDRLILGGDHLGPGIWQNEPASTAMQKSTEMVQAYIKAGYTKIHLDASMKLRDDDPSHPLDLGVVAYRTAILAKAAELTMDPQAPPCYVIGSEVPKPGGALEPEAGIQVTSVRNVQQMLETTQEAFHRTGLDKAWERVLALVVQPGVEFGNDFVLDYKPELTRDLAGYSESTAIIFEAHSTDYQTRNNLRRMVCDHFAILKVGPALTFAFREAIFALARIENELIPAENHSNLIEVIEEVMVQHPQHWQKYYRGDEGDKRLARKFSFSDRIRYYWKNPQVQIALEQLLQNLGHKPLPVSLIRQYAPCQLKRILKGESDNSPGAIILDKINSVLEDYTFACA